MRNIFKNESIPKLMMVATALLSLIPQQGYAQTNHARTLNFPFYSSAVTSSCGTSLTGSDNEQKVYNYLIAKGMTPIQAAGSMGNLKHEGGFNPKRVEDGWGFPREMDSIPPNVGPQGQPGYGIVQWTSPGRKQGLGNMASQKSLPVYDLGVQLDYMWSELEGPYKGVALDPILASNDLAEVTRIWQTKYEVGTKFEPRFKAAQDYLAKYGSSSTPTASGGGCGGTGQVVGGLSLPLDRKWYDQYPERFTGAHHGDPNDAAVDIAVPTGNPVYAVAGGKVIQAPTTGTCGVGIIIDTPEGIRFTYCHGSDGGSVPGARQGDTVQAGQLIMHSASTGRSTGPHLHLEVTVNGQDRCPQPLLVGIAKSSPPDLNSLPTRGCTSV